MMRFAGFKPGDAVVVTILLLLSVGVIFATAGRGAGMKAIVTVDGKKAAVLLLGVEDSLEVEGPLGVTKMESGAMGVAIVSSPCPLKYCVRQGYAKRTGQVIVCVPNRIAIRITGGSGSKDGVDGVSG